MKKLAVNWTAETVDTKVQLLQYRRYLERIGLKENTIKLYTNLVDVYLRSNTTPDQFYDSLVSRKLSRSARNNYAAAITRYHAMLGQTITLPFVKVNNALPFYFEESDILKLFSVMNNIKHLAMFKVLFFGCLRSGELCKLDLDDYNQADLTLRLRETKNGTDALTYLNEETTRALNAYLAKRPPVESKAMFISDYGNRYRPNDIYKIFMDYKVKAKVTRKGGVHCFSRHSSATLMVSRGCDLRSVQAVLRHRDINTTLRYAHLSDVTKRERQLKYLSL